MLAFHTKFIPATDTKQARIKDYSCNGHSIIIPLDYSLGDEQRHFKAVKALIDSQLSHAPDSHTMTFGGSADGKGYTFCFMDSKISPQF